MAALRIGAPLAAVRSRASTSRNAEHLQDAWRHRTIIRADGSLPGGQEMKRSIALATALLTCAGIAWAQETTLNAVLFVPRNTTFGEIFARFVDHLNAQALGVSLVQTPPGEVMTALERGVVDGYGWPAIGIFDLGWGTYTKYRIDPGFYNVVVNVLVNLDKWQSLREDQRAALNRAAAWLEEENVRWVAERKAADDKRIKEAGIQAIDLGAGLRKLAYDAYWDALAKRAAEPIKELKANADALR